MTRKTTRTRGKGPLLRTVAAVIAAGLVWRSFVAVDETEHVVVTQFGRYIETLREPGLHPILPYRSVLRFDRRLQIYDPRPSEFLTSDPKNILLDIYVCWRIGDPLAFLQGVTDMAGAEMRLHDIVWSEVAAEVGCRPLNQLVSDQPGEMMAADIFDAILERCGERLGNGYGIDLVDVRLKRLNLPEQNKQSVFDRMRAERERIARMYRAEGEEQALRIRAEADREKALLLAAAARDAELIRGEAEQEAIRVYAAAHGQAPEFYQFLRSLEVYRAILTDKTTLVLSADSDLLRYLTGPQPRSNMDPLPGPRRQQEEAPPALVPPTSAEATAAGAIAPAVQRQP